MVAKERHTNWREIQKAAVEDSAGAIYQSDARQI